MVKGRARGFEAAGAEVVDGRGKRIGEKLSLAARGGLEPGFSDSGEPTVRYHPNRSVSLTYSRKPGEGHW